jgi:rRNA maturation endonuclease Nob1
MPTAIADPEWIKWKMVCHNCGYKFKAITPELDYISCEHCTLCGSGDIEKELEKC